MAKMLINQSSVSAQYAETMRKQLESSNLNAADIDKLIQARGLENILTDKNLGQYFRNCQSFLGAITNPFPEGKALSAAVPDMLDYQSYWSKDLNTNHLVAGMDFIPNDYLHRPEQFGKWIGLNEREQTAYNAIYYGPPTTPQGAPAPAQGQGAGGSGTGGYGGGSSGGGKALSTGGGTKALGGPPSPPPGMGGGYPPGGGGYGGGYGGGSGYASENLNFFPQAEWNWTQQNLQGIPGADWMQPLFTTTQQYREVVAFGTEQLNQLDQFQQRILMEFQTLDMTTPEGQRRQFVLMQQVQDLGSRRQEIVDKMMRIQHMNDEMIQGLKGLKEKAQEDLMAITRNIGK